MKNNKLLGLILTGAVLAGAQSAEATLVTALNGPYGAWSISYQGNAANLGAFSATDFGLTLVAGANPGASDLIVSLTVAQTSEFDLTSLLTANGASSTPLSYYYIDATQYSFAGGGATNFITVNAGSSISFELSSPGTSGGKSPATLELDLVGVPEAGGWLAGAFLAGVVGFQIYRGRKPAAS